MEFRNLGYQKLYWNLAWHERFHVIPPGFRFSHTQKEGIWSRAEEKTVQVFTSHIQNNFT